MEENGFLVTRGIVLRETQAKEADRILTVLTESEGKITIIAKGANSKKSRYAAAGQSLAFSEWSLRKKNGWYYAVEGNTIELFQPLREQLEGMALGYYMAELVDAAAEENAPNVELLSHLLNGLYALAYLKKDAALVKMAFEIHLMAISGYEPLADSCAVCGRENPESPMWDIRQGVIHCRTCDPGTKGHSMPLTEEALKALRYIVYGDPKRLYSFTLEETDLKQLGYAAEIYVVTQMERSFRSLDFYKSLQELEL